MDTTNSHLKRRPPCIALTREKSEAFVPQAVPRCGRIEIPGGAGVGRGNGRAKKAPPIKLGEFWDDSVAKSKTRRKSKRAVRAAAGDDVTDTDANGAVLVNKGTVRDFVSMMILGREAKQRMIQCNMRLAVSIAKRYRNVGVNIADLVQEGSIGLARAAEKFDPKRGFKFSTYASWYVGD